MFRRIRYSIIILSLINFCGTSVNAQKIVVSANAGYATFGLKSLRDQQREMAKQIPVPGKVVQSFPGYLNYFVDLNWQRDSVYFGLMFGHTSTGGRIAHADYSGYAHADHKLGMIYYGVHAATRVARGAKMNYFLGIQLLNYMHTLKINTREVVLDETFSSSRKYSAGSISLGPFLEVKRQYKKIIFRGRAAYEVHIPGTFDLKQGTNSTVDDDMKASASGARISLGAGYILK